MIPCIAYQSVGSATVPGCTPRDVDTLILVSDMSKAQKAAAEEGFNSDFSAEGAVYVEAQFVSVRKGKDNWIITDKPLFYERFCFAARLCTAAQVTDRPTRILVHNALINYKEPTK